MRKIGRTEVIDARIDVEPGATLVEELLAELRARYQEEDDEPPTPADLSPPSGRFWVVLVDGRPSACGGLKQWADGIGEVKRMYVHPSARRTGLARLVLDQVEAEARRRGYHELRLETGVLQPEAITLYESVGFTRVPCWGVYAGAPRSMCFAKRLD